MRFDTVIRNGTVVTATDTCLADVGINGYKVTAIAAQLPTENAGRVIEATGSLVIPGGIDVHTHLDMPFGGTTSADDFQTGTIAAAFGGTTTLIDFAIQYKGQTLRQAFDTWMKKAHDKAVTDYAFHCIITDLGSAQLEEMGQLIREGVTSFKLFMAYPGVFMLDDATIFKAMRQAAKHSGLICMHAGSGFGFGGGGAREHGKFWGTFSFGGGLLDEDGHGAAVFRVHADEAAVLSCLAHGLKDGGVVEHEDAGVGHEELEAGDAFANELAHLFELRGAEIGDDAVEGVVGDGFVVGFLHPGIESMAERLAFVLNGEVDEGSGAAESGGDGAGLEIVGAGSTAKGHVKVGVDVDAAGGHQAPRGVHLKTGRAPAERPGRQE